MPSLGWAHIANVLDAYIECALWASTDEDENPLDDWATADDLAMETRQRMAQDVSEFYNHCERKGIDHCEWTDEMLGHDFWLTRNGHGAGFWDRGRGKSGDDLTHAAHSFGEQWLYVGDDGLIYLL